MASPTTARSSSLEPVGDIIVWVDTKLRTKDKAGPQPVSSRLSGIPLVSMGSFAEGSLITGLSGASMDIPDMERRNMSLAECEQCMLDDFWGKVANQVKQAEAMAAMEMEDRLSGAVRTKFKKEERNARWEQEDFRTRETRSIVREALEDAARKEYLEVQMSKYSWLDSVLFRCRRGYSNIVHGLLPTRNSDGKLTPVFLIKAAGVSIEL